MDAETLAWSGASLRRNDGNETIGWMKGMRRLTSKRDVEEHDGIAALVELVDVVLVGHGVKRIRVRPGSDDVRMANTGLACNVGGHDSVCTNCGGGRGTSCPLGVPHAAVRLSSTRQRC